MDVARPTSDPASPAPPLGVQYMPGEDVLLLAVVMPAMSMAQRRAAVAFAVEDRIASALDDVHVVLGPALPASDNWLVAVVGRDVLANVTPDRKARLLPDTLALPIPEPGKWSVWTQDQRALVRTDDGAGFATTLSALPVYHLAAGRPAIMLYGGALDARYDDISPAVWPAQLDLRLARFDLNSHRDAGRGLILSKTALRLAAVGALVGIVHTGLLVTDIWALGHIRATYQQDLLGILDRMGQPTTGDLDADINQTLAQANGAGTPHLIAMMSRTFATLAPQAGRVTLNDLRYSADQGSLTLTLQGPDIVTLQGLEIALTDAGFRVTAGAATTAAGLAEQQLVLQGGDA